MNVSAWGYRGVRRGSRDEAPAGKGIIVRTQSLGDQTVDLLGRLVRLGCVNDLTADSGGEERAADLLEDFFEGLPVSIERITPHPGRDVEILRDDPVLAQALEAPGGDVLRSRLAVMSPRLSKGLEFDVVVLADPAVIGEASPGDLYVAMTRPTRRLRVISRTPLPEGLRRP